MYKPVVFVVVSMSLCVWNQAHADEHHLTLHLDLGVSDVSTETLDSPLDVEVADDFEYGPRAAGLSLALGSSFDLFVRGQTDAAYRSSLCTREGTSWGAESAWASSRIATVNAFDLGAGWSRGSTSGRWSVTPRLAISHVQFDSTPHRCGRRRAGARGWPSRCGARDPTRFRRPRSRRP